MAKLNQRANRIAPDKQIAKHPTATTNYAGGLAFTASPEAELYLRTASCLWQEPTFYGGQPAANSYNRQVTDNLGDIERAIYALAQSVDPAFVLRLALYARHELNLRTTPQVLLTVVANRSDLSDADRDMIRQFGPRIMHRADEVKEVVAFQMAAYTSSIPRPLRTAIAVRMGNLSQYEAMKYAGGQGVRWHDVLNYVHPKPTTEYAAALWRWMITGEIDEAMLPEIAARKRLNALTELNEEALALAEASRATWEVLLSQFGNRAEVWDAASLPYMATLRNLRNMIEAGVDLTPHLEKIRDPEQVRRSRQFPFRFWTALQTAGNSTPLPEVAAALRDALDTSVANMPTLPGMTAVFVDLSGSMKQPMSERSAVRLIEIAALMGAIAHRVCDNAIVGCFADRFEFVHPDERASVLTNMEMIRRTQVGGSTYAHKGFDALTQGGIPVDRIILLSDMQCYDRSGWDNHSVASSFSEYRRNVKADCRLVSIDLKGYGTLQFPEGDAHSLLLGGWSERLFDLIGAWESAGEDALDRIRAVE